MPYAAPEPCQLLPPLPVQDFNHRRIKQTVQVELLYIKRLKKRPQEESTTAMNLPLGGPEKRNMSSVNLISSKLCLYRLNFIGLLQILTFSPPV
jgi:hypothetical protein